MYFLLANSHQDKPKTKNKTTKQKEKTKKDADCLTEEPILPGSENDALTWDIVNSRTMILNIQTCKLPQMLKTNKSQMEINKFWERKFRCLFIITFKTVKFITSQYFCSRITNIVLE